MGNQDAVFPTEYPNPEAFWRNTRSLNYARENALAYARNIMQQRRINGIPKQAYLDAHDGKAHISYAQSEFPWLIQTLPRHFIAIETGAGMGWHAALLASYSEGRILAIENSWKTQTPYHLNNVHVLKRLTAREAQLEGVLKFQESADGQLTGVSFGNQVHILHASATQLPVSDTSVDLVYSVNCVEHIQGLERAFAEAARVLRPGGILFASTEPLYYSKAGHHLDDFFPIPWGHLLWPAQELVEMVLREGEPDREWNPGTPLTAEPLRNILNTELNYASPRDIRTALIRGPWSINAWLDVACPDDLKLAKQLSLHEALHGISMESLLLYGLRFRLIREKQAKGLRLPLRLDFIKRKFLRNMMSLYR